MSRNAHQPTAPVTVPHLVLDVHTDGTVTASLDGARLEPDDLARVWRRESLPQIIDRTSGDRTIPVRVEVRETDGRRFTDIIPPIRRRATAPTPDTNADDIDDATRTGPVLVEVSGTGFVPGEDVTIAVAVSSSSAGPGGTARALIDPAALTQNRVSGVVEVVLLGRISGITHIEHLP